MILTISTMRMLIIVVLAVGAFATVNSVQQANADHTNGKGKKSCNDQYSGSAKCSQGDTTPFILPFP
jgi:hypothetical protein